MVRCQSTLKTFFAKLPDSLLSSSKKKCSLIFPFSSHLFGFLELSNRAVEASRIEIHCDRLVELKGLISQLDD